MVVGVLLSWSAQALAPAAASDAHRSSLREIARTLDKRHYRKLPLDDSFSEALFALYLKRLDPGRIYLLASDIDDLESCRTRLDDELKAAVLDCGFRIHNRFQERLIQRLQSNLAHMKGADSFDFDRAESLPLNTDELPWMQTTADADDYWRRRMKDSLLRLMISGKEDDAARELLIKRYSTQLKRMNQQTADDAFDSYVNAVAAMYDPHTSFMDARSMENFQISMSLSLEGIGAVLQSEDEHTKVVRVVPGGPADKVGNLHAGDRITGVGQGRDGELVDVIGWRLDDVVDLIRGKKGTEVRIEILPAKVGLGGRTEVITIVREQVKLEEQAARGDVISLPVEDRKARLGVITLPTFYMDFEAFRNRDQNFRSTTRDVFNILQQFRAENLDGIIVDLRNNGGGSLYEATALTDLFIDPGPVVQIRHADRSLSLDQVAERPAVYRGPLVVLINRLSASASEIFAAAIQDYQRGLVLGSQSFGKGTVQVMTPLRNGQLKLTQSKFYRVSGDSTQERGVVPDISFPSLYDLQEIGERSQDRALPWDRIDPVEFQTYGRTREQLPTLQGVHYRRVATDPDWRQLLAELALVEQNRDLQELPLRRQDREQLIREREEALFALANQQRSAKGEKAYADLEAWRKDRGGEAHTAADGNAEGGDGLAGPQDIDEDARNQPNPDKDALLKEAGYVLADYAGLLGARREQLAKRNNEH